MNKSLWIKNFFLLGVRMLGVRTLYELPFVKVSQSLLKEKDVYCDYRKMSLEIHEELSIARQLIIKGKNKSNVLNCYKNLFTSLCEKSIDIHVY